MMCSARSFSFSQSSAFSDSSDSASSPRGRVPAIGRVLAVPPATRSSRSGEELSTENPGSRAIPANGAGFATRRRRYRSVSVTSGRSRADQARERLTWYTSPRPIASSACCTPARNMPGSSSRSPSTSPRGAASPPAVESDP